MQENHKNIKPFLFFWSGQSISLLGSAIVQFTIIWWITVTTESPLMLSLAAFLGLGSSLLVGPFAGVVIDRYNRRFIIAFFDTLEALATIVLIYLFLIEEATIIQVLGLLTARGVFDSFHSVAVQSIPAMMVEEKTLSRINSLDYFSSGLIFIVGPIIGAILLETIGINNMPFILLIDAITFLIAVIPLIFITIPPVPKNTSINSGEQADKSFFNELKDGIAFLYNRSTLLALLVMYALMNFSYVPINLLLPLMINDNNFFNSGADVLALAFTFFQIGTIGVALLLTGKTIFKSNIKGVFIGIYVIHLSVILITLGAIYHNPYLLYLGMGIRGVGFPVANIHSQVIWQTTVPIEYQGRVFSVRRTIALFMEPVAMLLTGIFAESLGYIFLFIFAGVFGLSLLTLAWLFTSIPQVEQIPVVNA